MAELRKKTCSKCKQEKYTFEFSRNKNSRDKLACTCKECYKVQRIEREKKFGIKLNFDKKKSKFNFGKI